MLKIELAYIRFVAAKLLNRMAFRIALDGAVTPNSDREGSAVTRPVEEVPEGSERAYSITTTALPEGSIVQLRHISQCPGGNPDGPFDHALVHREAFGDRGRWLIQVWAPADRVADPKIMSGAISPFNPQPSPTRFATAADLTQVRIEHDDLKACLDSAIRRLDESIEQLRGCINDHAGEVSE